MATFNGILVDTTFLQAVSGGVQQNLIGVSDGIGCENCNGSGVIVHTSITSGPYEYPPSTGNGHVAVPGQIGWFIGESTTAPCPVCSGNQEERVSMLINNSQVPVAKRSMSLDFYQDMEDKKMLVAACDKILEKGHGVNGLVTFFGSNGTGKTTASMILCVSLCRIGVRAMYTTAQEIANMLKETWGKSDRDETDVVDALMRVKFLVIDEVDRVSPSDTDRVNQVIDKRYQHKDRLATLLITNMNISRIDPGEDAYLKSRMADGIRVPVYGEDMR